MKANSLEEVRLIKNTELDKLLSLYNQLHPEDPKPDNRFLSQLWNEITHDPNLFYIVATVGDVIVSSCTLAIIKNLTRGARPYGIVENVITDRNYRNMGYGSSVLKKAIELATENNCYKVMLMTGSKKEATLNFYQKAGFRKDIKTGFLIVLD